MLPDFSILFTRQFKNPLLYLLLITLSFSNFASDAANAGIVIKRLDARFSGIASTKKIGTMGIDSMNTFFETVLKKIPAIETLMRINSSGMVINEVTALTSDFKMRNVSEQKWFTHTKSTQTPYYGTSRDSSGTTMFFWVWPIITNDSIFNGAISAKIKPSEIVKMASIKNKTALILSLNGISVYKQNIEEITSAAYDTVTLSELSQVIIQTQNTPISDTLANSDTPVKDGIDTSKTAPASVNTPTEPPVSSPVIYKSDFLEPTPKKSHAPLTIIITIILSLFFLAAALYVILRNRQAQRLKDATTLPEIDPAELDKIKLYPSFSAEDETLAIVDLQQHSDITEQIGISDHQPEKSISVAADKIDDTLIIVNNDDETKSHPPMLFTVTTPEQEPKQAAAIDEPLDEDLLETSMEISPELKQRNALYQEVHNEVMHWVISETTRLDSRIDELQKRLAIIEKLNAPEIVQFQRDIQDVSKDINSLKSHLTKDDN